MRKTPLSRPDIDHGALVSLLSYDPETGLFSLKRKRQGPPPKRAGLGDVNYDGYIRINVLGRRYYAHRLAWFYAHGKWPAEQLDHINGIRDDNRLENLREATQSGNGQNKVRQRNNTSGCIGVTWSKSRKKWLAKIGIGKKMRYLGVFDLFDDAVKARQEAKNALHQFSPKERPLTPAYRRAPCREKASKYPTETQQ